MAKNICKDYNMNKKDNLLYDIPKDDIECWNLYPKHRWVYDISRVLDAQNIKWNLLPDERFTIPEPLINLQSITPIETGIIYTDRGELPLTEVETFIIKGEIKLIRYVPQIDASVGNIELRINAFTTMHFSKFTGVIVAKVYNDEIYRIQLRPYDSTLADKDKSVIKLISRIYKLKN